MARGRPKRTGPKPEPLNMMVEPHVKKRFDEISQEKDISRPKTLERLIQVHDKKTKRKKP